MSAMQSCPMCAGRKWVATLHGPLLCDACKGTGEIAAGYAERKVAGAKLREERRAAGMTLGQWCRAHGEDLVTRSRRERGIE